MAETIRIQSRANQHVVRVRRARDRKEPGEIFVEGVRLVEESLLSGSRIIFAVAADDFTAGERQERLLNTILERGVDVIEIPKALFHSLADTANSQGIAILAERPQTGPQLFRLSDNEADSKRFLYLDKVSDPSNLGAVMRTAEAAGLGGVIISPGSADVFSPRALRASMGSSLRLPIWERCAPSECFAWARNFGLSIVAADPSAKKSYTDIDWGLPVLAVFGSEGHGLETSVLAEADEIVAIPMENGVESLNLAVAVGIVMFEGLRQRKN